MTWLQVLFEEVGRREGFPGNSAGKEPACQCRQCRDMGLIPGSGRPLEKEVAAYSSKDGTFSRKLLKPYYGV